MIFHPKLYNVVFEIENEGNNEGFFFRGGVIKPGHILKKVGTFFEFMPVAILPFPWSLL